MLELSLVRKRFGKEIAIYRLDKGICQDEMAKKLGLSRGTLSSIENGTSTIDDYLLVALYNECHLYLFFMILYAFFGAVVHEKIKEYSEGIYKPIIDRLMQKLRELGPVDKIRYYDNDDIRVTYKRTKKDT